MTENSIFLLLSPPACTEAKRRGWLRNVESGRRDPLMQESPYRSLLDLIMGILLARLAGIVMIFAEDTQKGNSEFSCDLFARETVARVSQ
jgi:hypothetical protein